MNRSAVSLVVAGALLLMLVGCENAGPGGSPAEVAEGEATVNRTITVSGEIAERYDNHTFSLGDQEWGENLVIVTKNPLAETVGDDTVLEVTGTVGQYQLVEFEREYGWDFDPQVEVELEDKQNFLYAESYRIVERDQ